MKVTSAQISQFQQQGFIHLKKVFSTDLITACRQAVIAHNERYQNDRHHYRVIGRFRSKSIILDLYTYLENPAIKAFLFQSGIGEVVGTLLQANTVRLCFEQTITKYSSAANHTPWHDDTTYLDLTGAQICRSWIPLETITPDCSYLEFIRGSHRWQQRYTQAFAQTTMQLDQNKYELMPDIEATRAQYDIVSLDQMDVGDCVVFYDRTIHSATAQRAESPRHAISPLWIGDQVQYHHNPNKGLYIPPELKQVNGEPVLPVVWPSD